MAKTLYSQSGKIEYGIKKYTVDTEADKEALNLRTTKMGSKCYVIDTKKWYILNSSNQWVPFVDAGGSDGSPFNIKGSVATVNDLPTEDNKIGDLYIVQEDHGEWIWLTNSEEPNGYWEQLGTNILPETIVTVTDQMTAQQVADIRNNIDSDSKALYVTVDDTTFDASETFDNIIAADDEHRRIIFLIPVGLAIAEAPIIGRSGRNYITAAASSNSINGPGIITYNLFSDESHNFSAVPLSPITITDPDTSIILSAQDNTKYKYGELTSLTITDAPATGAYSIVFTSGSTATSTTFPATILGLEDFAAEANTIYEINVLDNRAVVGSWAVSA